MALEARLGRPLAPRKRGPQAADRAHSKPRCRRAGRITFVLIDADQDNAYIDK
jgi:hypothetical protein